MLNLNDPNVRIIGCTKEFAKPAALDTGIIYMYQGKKYYYKCKYKTFKDASYKNACREILAEKIAKKLGIPCCHHFLTRNNDDVGVSSEMVDMTSIESLVGEKYNNFESIWTKLIEMFGDESAGRLMDELVDIFLFDIIIANCDRNAGNLGLVDVEDKDSVRWAPLFDNERMLSPACINADDASLLILQREYEPWYWHELSGIQRRFALYYGEAFRERIKKMLPVISEESILEILKEMKNEGVKMPEEDIQEIIELFEKNRNRIEERLIGIKEK